MLYLILMKTEIDPKTTERAQSFEIWKNAPMPKVTIVKTFDVSRLVRFSRRKGLKINMLMCWCIARAAKDIKEFYMLPMGEKYLKYDRLAVNIVVPVGMEVSHYVISRFLRTLSSSMTTISD